MYLVLEQSVRTMRYLRVRRKYREWFGGASFRRIESTDSLRIRASVVYCRPKKRHCDGLWEREGCVEPWLGSEGREDSRT